MPIQQLNTSEMLHLSPNLFDKASSLKNSLTPRARKSSSQFCSIMSPRLHSPAKQLETNLIKNRISKFIVELQRKQLAQDQNTLAPPTLALINECYNSPRPVFSLSPKIEAQTEIDSFCAEWILASNLHVETNLEVETEQVYHLNSKAKPFTPAKQTKAYVPPHKRSGARPANVDWRTGEVMPEPIRLRLVPWFHTLTKEQKQHHNKQCAALRVLRTQQKKVSQQR